MFQIGKDVKIDPTAIINVKHGFIGDRSIIGKNAVIEGFHVEIGAEAWIYRNADVGGGSCHDPQAKLQVGDFLHMGLNSHINFAYPVLIGHEFGCGIETKIFSHGAYQSAWDGFPVQWAGITIGDRVWMPNAWVNPGVNIGANVVIGARSLVNSDIPEGALAAGTPAKIIRTNAFPRKLTPEEKLKLFSQIFLQAQVVSGEKQKFIQLDEDCFKINDHCVFDLKKREIQGKCTAFTEHLRNQLRRNGIRFRFYGLNGDYLSWGKTIVAPQRATA